ncbi:MAG: type II secretion system protein N [Thiogranum sp.]|nr:type II secretion system protein N [Thiogranum sp.]
MKLWHGVALGLAAYAFFFVINAPAAKVLPALEPVLPPVQLQGIDGSVWSGSAMRASTQPVQLDAVRWELRPLALLTGRFEFALQGQLQDRPLQARAGKAWFGRAYLADVQGSVPAQDVLGWVQVRQVGVQGFLDFNLDEVRWTDARIPAIEGVMSWSPASIVTPVDLDFGTARLETQIGDNGATLGKLTTSGSALLVNADVQVDPGGSYRLDAAIRQEGEISDAVANFLSTFAEYRDGVRYFEWSSTL